MCCYYHLDVIKVKEYYDRFLTLMPINHEETISKLLGYLSDDQIAKILADKQPNKAILDNLYEKITCREDLLDFFHVLEISNIPQSILNELRHSKELSFAHAMTNFIYNIVYMYVHTYLHTFVYNVHTYICTYYVNVCMYVHIMYVFTYSAALVPSCFVYFS